MQNIKKKKLGVVSGESCYSRNLDNFGLILSKIFDLDLIGCEKIDSRLSKMYNTKNYTKIKRKNYFLWILKDIINIIFYCKKERPDILFSFGRADFQGPIIAVIGKIFRIKTVVRYSGSSFEMYKHKKGLNKILAYIDCKFVMPFMTKADKLICMGDEQKEELIKHGCKPEKISILIQPTDQNMFKPVKNKKELRLKLKLPLNKKIILYVGNLTNFKGADTLVKVVKDITKKRKNIFFLIVGADKEGYKIKFKEFENVRLTGKVSEEEVIKYYQSSDLYIHPSHIEGFPKTLLEAAACGLPSIARDIVGVGRVATHVFERDEKLIDLILNTKLKASDKSKLPLKFTWHNLEKKYLKVFTEAYNEK